MEEIKKLNEEKFTNGEIGEMLGISKKQVSIFLSNNGIKSHRFKNLNGEPNDLKQLILGSALGDGYLTVVSGNNKNSRLHYGHCAEQKDYLQWKLNILEKYNLHSPSGIYEYVQHSGRYLKGYATIYQGRSIYHPIFTKYRDIFYKERTKIVPKNSVDELDTLGLAIWYMDDGNVTTSSYQFNTQGFNKIELFYLQEMLLQNFSIHTTINSTNILHVKHRSSDLLIHLIKPHIIPSMQYKLLRYNDRVLNKSDKLLENPEEDNQQPITNLNG